MMAPTHLRLKQHRNAAGLTQEALAERVGVRQATISDLENGRSRRIDLDVLDRIAKVLGVKPGELFEQTRR